jgi:predicted enzyme related to lactoylglutathione lyase
MTLHPAPWPPGTPAWVDLVVPDLDTTRAFYAAVLGWEYVEGTAAGGGATYLTATVGGHAVAGLGDVAPDAPAPPAAWTVHLATDDVVLGVEAAVAAGASVLVPATRSDDAGAFAVLTDPTGAVFGLWEAGTHTGADLVDEPGGLAWVEAMSRDHRRAMDFYASVLGWTYTDMSAPGFTYATFDVDGVAAGGIGALPPDAGADAASHWLVYLRVEDVDAAVTTVEAHGGHIAREPWDSAFGRVVVATGPAGEEVALLATLEAGPAGGTGHERTA